MPTRHGSPGTGTSRRSSGDRTRHRAGTPHSTKRAARTCRNSPNRLGRATSTPRDVGRTTLAAVTDRQERAMSFGSIAEDYDGLRPQPPRQAVDWLVPPGCEVAVDVGAGTGLFTRTLVGRAAQVIAVEPDGRMRTVLTARSPRVRVAEGRGESRRVADAAADAGCGSSAWHWMDGERGGCEIGRVLRDGGRF